jgi:hypothetical protein
MRQNIIERARHLRGVIEDMAQELDDETALGAVELFPTWSGNAHVYAEGERVSYGTNLYECLTAHTSQPTWTPTAAPSLWARVLIPDPGTIPDWEQPESTNAYHKGDRVRHNGAVWVSDIDGNVWEPGVYGWTREE